MRRWSAEAVRACRLLTRMTLIALIAPAINHAADTPTFANLDTDRDNRLTSAEFLAKPGNRLALERDFRLFDANQDNHLSAEEFSGQVPDPLLRVLQRAVDAMDESYDGWQFRSGEVVDSTTFTINYAASLSTDGRRRLDRVLILHADPNRDRKVSREEATRFLEVQLGIRWITGDLLRRPNGQVVKFTDFLQADADQNNVLDKQEFIDNWWNSSGAEEAFDQLDTDADEEVTLGEFATPGGPNVVDTISDFRKADVDFDGLLSSEEVKAAIPRRRAYLVPANFRAFDDDGDGKLSLDEYRVSMLASYNYPWESMPKDEDRDHQLSLVEFKFDGRNLFQLQRRFYFHKLDADGDGTLSPDEFEFRKHKFYSLFRISVDGEESRELYRNSDFPVISSPSVSPDQRWILFDATPPEGSNRSQIILMTAEGEDARDLCDGLMPSWSSDGTQFACSRYEGGSGVWIMNLDGTPEKRIDDGWGAQWSPDGKSIAYTNDNSIRIYDVDSGQIRNALPKGSHPYLYIYWNMAWSPDSRRLAFRGRLIDKEEIAITSVSGNPNLIQRFASKDEMGSDLAWSPDGNRILLNLRSRVHSRSLIFQLDPESREVPVLVPEANTSQEWKSVTFSPDGQWMVLTTPN